VQRKGEKLRAPSRAVCGARQPPCDRLLLLFQAQRSAYAAAELIAASALHIMPAARVLSLLSRLSLEEACLGFAEAQGRRRKRDKRG